MVMSDQRRAEAVLRIGLLSYSVTRTIPSFSPIQQVFNLLPCKNHTQRGIARQPPLQAQRQTAVSGHQHVYIAD